MKAEIEDCHTLTRCQKLKKVLPKVLPLLFLSVILPTADVGTDLALITKLFKGLPVCVDSDRIIEWKECTDNGYDVFPPFNNNTLDYCTPEKVSNALCGVSFWFCDYMGGETIKTGPSNGTEYSECEEAGPENYCSPIRRLYDYWDWKYSVCGLRPTFDTSVDLTKFSDTSYIYFCRSDFDDFDDLEQCFDQGVDKFCSNPASNQNVCSHISKYNMHAFNIW